MGAAPDLLIQTLWEGLVSGVLYSLIALGFVCDMLGAILLVLLPKGFSGFELEFLLLASSLALALTGAGRFSVDDMLADRKKGNLAKPA